MDGIRRSGADPSISFTDVSQNNSSELNSSEANGISAFKDEIERAPAFTPDWTSGNASDPGITMLELPSFLSESLLYRADEIKQRSPHLSSLANTLAQPFYQNVTESLKASDASNDVSLIHGELGNMNYANLGITNSTDIEALCFLVLMAASKSAQEDLKSIMAGVKAINNAKAQLRETLSNKENLDSPSDSQQDVLRRLLTSANDALSTYETKWRKDE